MALSEGFFYQKKLHPNDFKLLGSASPSDVTSQSAGSVRLVVQSAGDILTSGDNIQ